jgi:hypothetical protein
MRRICFVVATLVCAIGLALCVWLGTFGEDTWIHLPRLADGGKRSLFVSRGSLVYQERTSLTPPPEGNTLAWIRALPFTQREWHGFEVAWGEDVGKVNLFMEGGPNFAAYYARIRAVAAPLWAVDGLMGILPVIYLRGWTGRRRVRRWRLNGCCVGCGYDLRGSGGRGSECGRETELAAS